MASIPKNTSPQTYLKNSKEIESLECDFDIVRNAYTLMLMQIHKRKSDLLLREDKPRGNQRKRLNRLHKLIESELDRIQAIDNECLSFFEKTPQDMRIDIVSL